MFKHASGLFFAMGSLVLAACGSSPSEGDSNLPPTRDKSNIISGTDTTDQTAVGDLDGDNCTASLIGTRVILSAAHCFKFDSTHAGLGDASTPPTDPGPSGHTFTVHTSAGAFSYNIHRFAVLSNNLGRDDFAIAELESDVPPEQATPLRLADTEPSDGATVTSWGYGCVDAHWDRTNGWNSTNYEPGGPKTTRSSTWKASTHTTNDNLNCPGDSGGPILNDAGDIVAVHSTGSGSNNPGGGDGNAQVWSDIMAIEMIRAAYGVHDLCDHCLKASFLTNDGQHYLQASGGGGSNINASPTEVGTWETFRLVALAGPWTALQADDGQFVSAVGGGGSTLTADKDRIGYWESFQLVWGEGFNASLQASGPAQFVSAEGGGGGDVNANRDSVGPWETFTVQYR